MMQILLLSINICIGLISIGAGTILFKGIIKKEQITILSSVVVILIMYLFSYIEIERISISENSTIILYSIILGVFIEMILLYLKKKINMRKFD